MSSPVFYLKVWKEFANQHGGKCKSSHTFGTLKPLPKLKDPWRKIKLIIPFSGSHIIFYSGESSSVKIAYNFEKIIGLKFNIYQEDYMDKIAKMFGKIEPTLFGSKFDDLFFITTSDERKLKNILSPNIQFFLVKHHIYVANLKLEIIKNSSVLEFNFPFDERNLEKLEETLGFMKEITTNIKKECAIYSSNSFTNS